MSRFIPLPLKTHEGRPLPHTFFEGDGSGLLIVLPGLHYGPDGPVLYHLAKRIQNSGWDTLSLTYGFQASMTFPWTEHVAETMAETTAAVREGIAHRRYPRLGIVGKSLGCIVLVQLCSQGVVPPEALAAYLTPPVGNPMFDSAFAATRQPAYIAIGTADSFYSDTALAGLQERRPALVRVVQGADHGIDVGGLQPRSRRQAGRGPRRAFLTGEVGADRTTWPLSRLAGESK
jgi:hypothetical protein